MSSVWRMSRRTLASSATRTRGPVAVPGKLQLERLEDRRLLIVNGTVTTGWPAVVSVGGASGVLITPTCVLTASHSASASVKIGGKAYTAFEVIRHPEYSSNSNDLAIVRLSQPVTGIAPIPILRSRPYIGQPATLAGFGLGGTDAGAVAGSGGVKRAGTTQIDGATSSFLVFSFRTRGEANIAVGDSGGPAVVNVAGVNYVAGIAMGHTMTSSALGDTAYHTRVDAYATWIDSVCRVPPATAAGITVTPTAGLVTTEAGGRATFTVRLNSRPSASVSIGVSSSDTTEGRVSTATLVFTPSNWSSSQTVTVTGVDDNLFDGGVAYSIVTAPAVSRDAAYNGLNPADVTVTNRDNELRQKAQSMSALAFAAGSVTGAVVPTDATAVSPTSRLRGRPVVSPRP